MKRKKIILITGICICSIIVILCVGYFYCRSWEFSLFIEPVYKIKTDEKVVALTFDDGPSSSRTPALLSLLEKYDVKATFFMIGKNIEKHPDMARRVYESGHLIGNHSFSHQRMIFKSYRFIKEEILATDRLILSAGQPDAAYFRPPYSKKLFILPLVLKSMNKRFVTCTYDPPSEYRLPFDGEKVAFEIMSHVGPGSIIVLHDGNDSYVDEFVKAVELTIIRLKEQGYRFVRLDEKL